MRSVVSAMPKSSKHCCMDKNWQMKLLHIVTARILKMLGIVWKKNMVGLLWGVQDTSYSVNSGLAKQ